LLVGELLALVGIGLLALWISYFAELVRPIDVWDFCPLPVALALILFGVWFTGLGDLILAWASESYKRDLAMALAFGILAELTLWGFFTHLDIDAFVEPETAQRYLALQSLPAPGFAILKYLYFHLGIRLSPHLGLVFVFAVPIAMWSLGAFTLFRMVRFLPRLHPKSK
jgi:hypothetical protein